MERPCTYQLKIFILLHTHILKRVNICVSAYIATISLINATHKRLRNLNSANKLVLETGVALFADNRRIQKNMLSWRRISTFILY